MKISVGADEKLAVVEKTLEYLAEKEYQTIWRGPDKGENQPWPAVAKLVAGDVVEGRADEGILFCWTGTGVSIAANKIPGIRAALCFDAETARGARLWNNANVLCISMRLTTEFVMAEILDSWFKTVYISNPDDDACLALVQKLDQLRS